MKRRVDILIPFSTTEEQTDSLVYLDRVDVLLDTNSRLQKKKEREKKEERKKGKSQEDFHSRKNNSEG